VILSVADNVIIANGLFGSFVGEVVDFEISLKMLLDPLVEHEETKGLVMNLEEKLVRVVIYQGSMDFVWIGQRLTRTGTGIRTMTGMCLLGTIISPLGDLLDTTKSYAEYVRTKILSSTFTGIFRKAPDIISRQPVKIPFITGIIAIDCFLPIGLGQRELVIGDLNTGKTSLAVTMILNQRFIINNVDRFWRLGEKMFGLITRLPRFTPCLYLLIGKRRSEVIRIQNVLLKRNAFHYTCIIYAGCDMKAALLYIAPFAVTSMGEWFMSKGYNPVMVFDCLTEHAVAYRQIALLLRRPPGREAYPGDIFYLHARLLERSAQLKKSFGGGSLTCIPLIETKLGDISAYIPTNVISITDGQIFLSRQMLNKGIKPAIYIELSVSRVGSNAQYQTMKEVCNGIKRDYRLYKDFEPMSKVASDLTPYQRSCVNRGLLIRKVLNQSLHQSYSYIRELLILFCVRKGLLDHFNHKLIDTFFTIFFQGHFSYAYVENRLDFFFFVDSEKQETMESFMMIGQVEDIEPEFLPLFESYSDFFFEEINTKLENDSKKAYLKSITKSTKQQQRPLIF
jgi:F-type H+-transporting ATPase subunit alpha